MITTTNDRNRYIGGSEANMIYMNYQSESFIKWWSEKLTELPSKSFTNKSMEVGTILEHDVIDLYERIHNVKGERDKQKVKGIARANTDYILEDKVSDVKVTKKAFEWFLTEKVPIHYKRQLIHYMYVFGLNRASIIAYQTDDNLLNNPFIKLDRYKLYEIPVKITKKEIELHKKKIEYLEFCKEMNVFPEVTNNG